MKKNQATTGIRKPDLESGIRAQAGLLTCRLGMRRHDVAIAAAAVATGEWQEELPELRMLPVPIKCTIDRFSLSPLAGFKDRSAFTDELDEALLTGEVDVVFQSLEESGLTFQSGIELVAVLPRKDVRDLVVTPKNKKPEDLKPGDRVGYYTEQQRVQFDRFFPNLQYRFSAGFTGPRLDKVRRGELAALLVPAADLLALNPDTQDLRLTPLATDTICPPPGRGLYGLRMAARRPDLKEMIKKRLDSAPDRLAAGAEEEVYRALGSPFNGPVGVCCETKNGHTALLSFNGLGEPDHHISLNETVDFAELMTAVEPGTENRPEIIRPLPRSLLPDGYISRLTGDIAFISVAGGYPTAMTEEAEALLKRAETIVYDDVKVQALLGLADRRTEIIYTGAPVRRLEATTAETTSEQAGLEAVLKAARAGRDTVRLFADRTDSLYPEAKTVERIGLRFRLSVGTDPVSRNLVYLGFPATPTPGRPWHIFDGRVVPDRSLLEALAEAEGSLCFNLAGINLPSLADELMRAGMPATRACLLAAHIGSKKEKILYGRLGEIAAEAVAADFPEETSFFVGPQFRPTEALSWWPKSGPLSGRHITVISTRFSERHRDLLQEGIDACGGTVRLIAWMQTAMEGETAENLDRQLATILSERRQIRGNLWFVISNTNGVTAMTESFKRLQIDFRSLDKVYFAALNKGVSDRLKETGLAADFVPEAETFEGLAVGLGKQIAARDRVAVIRGPKPIVALSTAFRRTGNLYYDCPAYETFPLQMDANRLLQIFADTSVLVLTSVAAAKALLTAMAEADLGLDDLAAAGIDIISRGKPATRFLRKNGIEPVTYTETGSMTDLLECIIVYGVGAE